MPTNEEFSSAGELYRAFVSHKNTKLIESRDTLKNPDWKLRLRYIIESIPLFGRIEEDETLARLLYINGDLRMSVVLLEASPEYESSDSRNTPCILDMEIRDTRASIVNPRRITRMDDLREVFMANSRII